MRNGVRLNLIKKSDLLIGDLIFISNGEVPENCLIVTPEIGTLRIEEECENQEFKETELILGEDLFLKKGTLINILRQVHTFKEIKAIVCGNI